MPGTCLLVYRSYIRITYYRPARQAQSFGHGINIKGRVNIINNLRYNGPSGVGNKFVDMRMGKGGEYLSLTLPVKADQGWRDGIARRAPIGRFGERRRKRDASTFRRYHKPPFGG